MFFVNLFILSTSKGILLKTQPRIRYGLWGVACLIVLIVLYAVSSPSRAGFSSSGVTSVGITFDIPNEPAPEPQPTLPPNTNGPGRPDSPGNSGGSNGEGANPHPGNSGNAPGNSGSHPGNSGNAPGHTGTHPGNSGPATGHTNAAPAPAAPPVVIEPIAPRLVEAPVISSEDTSTGSVVTEGEVIHEEIPAP